MSLVLKGRYLWVTAWPQWRNEVHKKVCKRTRS